MPLTEEQTKQFAELQAIKDAEKNEQPINFGDFKNELTQFKKTIETEAELKAIAKIEEFKVEFEKAQADRQVKIDTMNALRPDSIIKVNEFRLPENRVGTLLLAYAKGCYENINFKESVRQVTKDFGSGYENRIYDMLGKDEKGNQHKFMLSPESVATGGNLIINEMNPEILGLFYPETVCKEAGAQVITLNHGDFKVPVGTSFPEMTWSAPGGVTEADTPALTEETLSRKKGTIMVGMTNEMLRYPDFSIMQYLTNQSNASMKSGLDKAHLVGSGVLNQPNGIVNQAFLSNQNAQTGTTAALIEADLYTAKHSITQYNIPTVSRYWIMREETKDMIERQVVAANSIQTPWAKTLSETGKLLGYKVLPTNNLPSTSGDGLVILCDFSNVWIGQGRNLEIAFLPNATFNNAGTIVYGASQDSSVLRIIAETDVLLAYTKSCAVITGVTWGL